MPTTKLLIRCSVCVVLYKLINYIFFNCDMSEGIVSLWCHESEFHILLKYYIKKKFDNEAPDNDFLWSVWKIIIVKPQYALTDLNFKLSKRKSWESCVWWVLSIESWNENHNHLSLWMELGFLSLFSYVWIFFFNDTFVSLARISNFPLLQWVIKFQLSLFDFSLKKKINLILFIFYVNNDACYGKDICKDRTIKGFFFGVCVCLFACILKKEKFILFKIF